MQELIDHLKEKVGLTEDQATKAIGAVKDYVKQKFPMLEDAVENMFGQQTQSTTGTTSANSSPSDLMKDAAGKAEQAFDNVKDKLSGLFSDKK